MRIDTTACPHATPIYKTTGEGELRLHLFAPEGHAPADRRPAIVFFFGGGWQQGTPRQFYPHCAWLAAGGGSAGGQMAAIAGVTTSFDADGDDTAISARPNALVLFNPALDNGPEGAGHDRVRARWQEFSPLHNIRASAPPTAIFVGTDDHVLPVATAERYRDAMERAGVRCDLHLYPGQRHGFFNYGADDNPWYDRTLQEAGRFLASLGYLAGEAEAGA